MQPESISSAAAGIASGWPAAEAPAAVAEAPGAPAPQSGVDRSKAARSMVWSVVENGGLALVSFGSLVIYSRFLSPAEFGVFSVALALVELLGVLVSMLFHDALVQREHVSALHFDTAFTFTATLSVVLFGACALFSNEFARLFGNAAAAPVLTWTALCFPATAISATLVAQQRRELDFKSLALRSLVGRLSGAAVGIVLVALGAGIWGMVAQQVLIALVGSLVLWFTAESWPHLRFGWTELKQLLSFGAYSVGALFLMFAVKRVFVIVGGVMLGDEKAGYLNLSFRAVDVLWAIGAAAVTQVALPVLARLQSDPVRVRAAYRAAVEFTCLLFYPCFVGIALVAPEVIELLFGRHWLLSAPYVVALAMLVLVQSTRLLTSPMLTALGRPRDPLIGVAVEMVVMIALLFAVGAYSLKVAVAIWLLREVAAAPVTALILRRAAGISLRDQLSGGVAPAVSCALMAVAVCALRYALPAQLGALARLLVLVPAGALVFAASIFLVGRGSLERAAEFVAPLLGRARR